MYITADMQEKLTKLCFAEKSNKEIAKELNLDIKEVYAARSRLGITIPKVKAAKEVEQAAKRTAEEIQQEIDKVRKAMSEALKKMKRCDERIDQLNKELEACYGNCRR